jgi:hypothetical protein
MGDVRKKRVRSLGLAALLAGTVMIGGAWTWPTWPSWPPHPPTTAPHPTTPPPTTPPPTTPVGRPHLEFQDADPIVITSGPSSITRNIVIENTGPVANKGGFSVSISGSANGALSTGNCAATIPAGGTCTMTFRVRANAQSGTSKITIKGSSKSIGDSITLKVVKPPAP